MIISDCVKKNSISNLLVIGILEYADNLFFFFFYHSLLSAQTCRFPEETKKNPRTENQGSKKRLYIYLHICQIILLPKKSPNEKDQNKKEIPL